MLAEEGLQPASVDQQGAPDNILFYEDNIEEGGASDNCDSKGGGSDDEDVLGDNYHCQRIGGREAGMAESNPGLWIPEEDTLATVYMTISRAMMMIRVMITGVSFFCEN